MEARSSTAEGRRAGDQDQDTRVEEEEEEGATGGEDTEEEGAEGTGAPRKGSAEESSEDAETTGSEEEAPAGPEVEVTLTSTGARRRALTARRRWVEAGTTGAEGGRLEEEVHPEEEEGTTVIETVSRCMMGHLRPVASAPPPCRGWTWRLCRPGSVRGRTGREPETPESESPRGPTEVAPLRGRTGATARPVEVDEAAGVPEDRDRPPGEEDQHPEDHRGGADGAGSPDEKHSHDPRLLRSSLYRPQTESRS